MKAYFSRLIKQSNIGIAQSPGRDNRDRDLGDGAAKTGLSGQAIDFHETRFIDGQRGGNNVERQELQDKVSREVDVRYKGRGGVTPDNGTDNIEIDSAPRPSRKMESGTEEPEERDGEFEIRKGVPQGSEAGLTVTPPYGDCLQGEGVRPGGASTPEEAPIVEKPGQRKMLGDIDPAYGKELILQDTLREVREWLTEIPEGLEADDYQKSAPGEIGERRVRIPGHQKDDNEVDGVLTAGAYEVVHRDIARSTLRVSKREAPSHKGERSDQEIHLSIGSINLTVEEPHKENQDISQPRRVAEKHRESDNSYSSRLSRHYIHTR